jgi:hypothetical protein
MDEFMGTVLASLREHGARAVRVFPPAAQVLLAFADRIAGEIVSLPSMPCSMSPFVLCPLRLFNI